MDRLFFSMEHWPQRRPQLWATIHGLQQCVSPPSLNDGLSVQCVMQYNYLNAYLPQYDEFAKKLMRSAILGFSSSFVSDTCSNSIRVIKTTRQTATTPMTYPQVVRVS